MKLLAPAIVAAVATGEALRRPCYSDGMREPRVEGRGTGQATSSTAGSPGLGKDQKDAAYKKWVEAYDAYKKEAGDPYHALPEEADAWAVAGKMKATYTKK
jgi:hypothetical protein